MTEEQKEVQNLLLTVLRFNDTTYKLGRSNYLDERVDLAGLQDCADRLIYEINVESVATGLQVNVEVSSLLGLNLIHKMKPCSSHSLGRISWVSSMFRWQNQL